VRTENRKIFAVSKLGSWWNTQRIWWFEVFRIFFPSFCHSFLHRFSSPSPFIYGIMGFP
jgi:hypothetical protein